MAEYTKKVDAVQFLVTDEQKADFESGKSISHEVFPIKYDGELTENEEGKKEANASDFYHVRVINHEVKKVYHGNYLILNDGTPVDVVSEADFKASHSEV